MANRWPIHHCDPNNPCPVLLNAKCEGPDPSKWKRPAWMPAVINDAEVYDAEVYDRDQVPTRYPGEAF